MVGTERQDTHPSAQQDSPPTEEDRLPTPIEFSVQHVSEETHILTYPNRRQGMHPSSPLLRDLLKNPSLYAGVSSF